MLDRKFPYWRQDVAESLRFAGFLLGCLLALVVGLAALVGVMYLLVVGHDALLAPIARTAPWPGTLAFAALAGVAALGAYLLRYSEERDARLVKGGLIFTAAAAAFASYSVEMERESVRDRVADYCSYGAVSDAQLAECQAHVGWREVSADTPAALFARAGSDAECGPGNGPFCQQVLDRRYLEDQMDQP